MLAGRKGSSLGRGNTWATMQLQQKLQPHPAGMAFQRHHSFLIKEQDFELHVSWIWDAHSHSLSSLGRARPWAKQLTSPKEDSQGFNHQPTTFATPILGKISVLVQKWGLGSKGQHLKQNDLLRVTELADSKLRFQFILMPKFMFFLLSLAALSREPTRGGRCWQGKSLGTGISLGSCSWEWGKAKSSLLVGLKAAPRSSPSALHPQYVPATPPSLLGLGHPIFIPASGMSFAVLPPGACILCLSHGWLLQVIRVPAQMSSSPSFCLKKLTFPCPSPSLSCQLLCYPLRI